MSLAKLKEVAASCLACLFRPCVHFWINWGWMGSLLVFTKQRKTGFKQTILKAIGDVTKRLSRCFHTVYEYNIAAVKSRIMALGLCSKLCLDVLFLDK